MMFMCIVCMYKVLPLIQTYPPPPDGNMFVPTHLEIKGLAEYADRRTKSIVWDQAAGAPWSAGRCERVSPWATRPVATHWSFQDLGRSCVV